ncbi:MAG: metallophosphoesterase [Gloeocapsa sp. DLM2.Bin57]|nr:MAG: metallophosphoesterase [Gloeocapsa sp. DLM2.Bin57]
MATLPELVMLSDPFLQLPTSNTVNVVWFTEFVGVEHYVLYGNNLEHKVQATTTKLSKVAEDSKSHWTQNYAQVTPRNIWRHEAVVTGLTSGKRLPYQVVSKDSTSEVTSKIFSLTAKPSEDSNIKILLTSDHQLMPMTAANLEKVAKTVTDLDGIFLAGDLVNIPDRASEWFDDQRGGAFFPCLQGKANYKLKGHIYHGGELIQHIPIFTAVGNHEVMGRFAAEMNLNEQFKASFPRKQATRIYPEMNSTELKNFTYNTDTYEEIFSLPEGQKYYSLSFGNLWLGVLSVTNMWRSPIRSAEVTGRYQEKIADLDNPESWGYGQHIFGAIETGSEQYRWLETELNSTAFQQAKYKIVMFHHPPHSLGGNVVPPYTTPIQHKQYNSEGQLEAITYSYPQENDYIIRDLIPLLTSAGVDLVYYGHSHLWNRFYDSNSKLHFLESSNVGNSYGAHWGNNPRRQPRDYLSESAALGNPNGLEPIVPTIAPLTDESGTPLPYIASNEITVFSILDTSTGNLSSYRFDTTNPDHPVIKFDEFNIGK